MSSYTITITPEDTSNASATLQVSLGATGARITELTIRAGEGEGLLPDEVPGFDLTRFLRAINPSPAGAPVVTAAIEPPATVAAQEATTAPDAAPAAPVESAPVEATAEEAAPARTGRARTRTARSSAVKAATTRSRAAKSATAKAATKASTIGTTKVRAAKAGTAKADTAKADTAGTATTASRAKRSDAKRTVRPVRATAAGARTRSAKSDAGKATAPARAGRAYRRMPDDLAEVRQQVGAASAIANHYGVPRHTVQGWLRRLNKAAAAPAVA